ncbi:MAG: hypothetical protein NTW14_08255 [bacterium]|nr:hypothetical protein [bacterium]
MNLAVRLFWQNKPGQLLLSMTMAALLIASAMAATIPETLYNEITFLHGTEVGSGGRATALGGAYISLSDDLSGLYWNPAGLASVRRIEMSFGMSQIMSNDEVAANAGGTSSQLSKTRLNEFGVVFPFPTYRGSLVFALGYHQAQSYEALGTFHTVSGGSTFNADELEEGRLGFWSLGGAIDLSAIVSAGLALRLWTGYDDYSYNSTNYANASNWDKYEQSINDNLSGFNVMTGVLVHPTPWLRVGATLESPLRLTRDEGYREFSQTQSGGQYSQDDFSANYSYRVTRSFRAGLGTAVIIGPVGLSGDIVLNDWSQITYKDDPPLEDWTRETANKEITQNLRPTADLRGGVEVWLPFAPLRLQGGLAYIPSPFRNESVISNKTIYSGGISAMVDQSLQVQAAVSFSNWDRIIGGWGEKLSTTHLTVSMAYRF